MGLRRLCARARTRTLTARQKKTIDRVCQKLR
jgi:hypothetical protein